MKIAQIRSTSRHARQRERKGVLRHQVSEKGYTQESAGRIHGGTSVKVVAVYPGGIDTAFYCDSRDYVSGGQAAHFMQPGLAEVIPLNLINEANLSRHRHREN